MITEKEQKELDDLNDHYSTSRSNFIKSDMGGESHLEYYKNIHPEKFKRLTELIDK